MSRYQQAFDRAQLDRAAHPLVFPFLTAGFPTPAETNGLIAAALNGGAAGLEIGVPFSDPLADGPTHQRAYTTALANGATLQTALDAARHARAVSPDAPITLMGYLNPFLAYGSSSAGTGNDHSRATVGQSVGRPLEPLAAAAADAGVDGIIVVDLPVDESDAARAVFAEHGLNMVYLLAPTSTPERIAAVAERAAGFIYLVSVTGVTGARAQLAADIAQMAAQIRQASSVPLGIGFGITSRAHVKEVGEFAQAAIIGSALTATIADAPAGGREAAVQQFLEVVTGRRSDKS